MRINLKKFKQTLFLFVTLFLASCSEELYNEQSNSEIGVKTSKLSLKQVLEEVNSTSTKNELNNLILVNSQNNSLSKVNNSEVYFTKKEKENILTSYILNINSYSQTKPYFLKLIITKNNNETERMGYIKYIPLNPETNLDLHTFTGEVQILDFNFEITAKSEYINGIKQQSSNNSNRLTCVNEITVTEVRCSNGGDHGVGETCHNSSGAVIPNDAHFLISIFERCTSRSGDLVQIIEDPSSGGNNNTGGIYPASIFLNPFLNTLTQEQQDILNSDPSFIEYLLNNIVITPNPAYNPLIGGEPNLIIIEPEVESEIKNILTLLTDGTINGQPVDFGDSTPITNMSQYLSCFNTTQGAVLTISADQPDAGDHDLFTISGGVGHSFITIQQGSKIRSLGFYPISGPQSVIPNLNTPDPNDFINTPGEFHNNQSTSFDVSLSVPISATQLTNLINSTVNAANSNPVYNLSTWNCTDVAIFIFEAITNVNLPSCESPRILWDGQTPGTLGEIIRDFTTPTGGTKNTNGGTSPQNIG